MPYDDLASALAGNQTPQQSLPQALAGKGWTADQEARGLADEYWRGLKSLLPQTWGQAGEMAAYATPGLGNALSARDAVNGALDRDWWKAGLGAVGAVPFLGGMAKPFEVNYFGKGIKVLHNPSPAQTTGFLNQTKYKAGRRIVDPETGDTFIWDAADPALHHMMAEKLGVNPEKMTADMIGID